MVREEWLCYASVEDMLLTRFQGFGSRKEQNVLWNFINEKVLTTETDNYYIHHLTYN